LRLSAQGLKAEEGALAVRSEARTQGLLMRLPSPFLSSFLELAISASAFRERGKKKAARPEAASAQPAMRF